MPESTITKEQQFLLDEIFEADMNLKDFRAWKKETSEGDNISATEYMKQKALPEAERAAAKAKRIAESKEGAQFGQFLDDKFLRKPLRDPIRKPLENRKF